MSDSSESSAEVQKEVESERAELVSTLDQLRENLKPENVVDEVMANAKISASELSQRVWDVARHNPIPATLIGLGALMLVGVGQTIRGKASSNSRSSDDDEAQSMGSSPGSDRSRTSRDTGSRQTATLSARLRSADAQAAAAAARISESAHRLRDQAAGQTTAIRRNIKTLAGDTRMSHYPRSTSDISNSLSRLIDEQPLVLAAIGLAVGAAIGAALPSTETESRLLGDASVTLKSRAQQLATSEFEHLKETAGSTLEDLKQTAADRGVSTDNLRGLVQDASNRVRDAAADVADHAADTAGIKSST